MTLADCRSRVFAEYQADPTLLAERLNTAKMKPIACQRFSLIIDIMVK